MNKIKQHLPLIKACIACMVMFWAIVLLNHSQMIRFMFHPHHILNTLSDIFVCCIAAITIFYFMRIKLLWKYEVIPILVWLALIPFVIALVHGIYFDDVFVRGMHRNRSHFEYMGYGWGAAGISYALFLKNGPEIKKA